MRGDYPWCSIHTWLFMCVLILSVFGAIIFSVMGIGEVDVCLYSGIYMNRTIEKKVY